MTYSSQLCDANQQLPYGNMMRDKKETAYAAVWGTAIAIAYSLSIN